MQEVIWGLSHQNWNGRVLTDEQVDPWICLYKWGKHPQLLRKLTLAHNKFIPIHSPLESSLCPGEVESEGGGQSGLGCLGEARHSGTS